MKLSKFKALFVAVLVLGAGGAVWANDEAEETVVAFGEKSLWLGPDEIVVAVAGEKEFWLGPDEILVASDEFTFNLGPKEQGLPGSEGNPWPVGGTGHETEVTAWTNGVGTLFINGTGAAESTPWAEVATGITRLQKAENVTGIADLMATLPDLANVNGLSLADFNVVAAVVAPADITAMKLGTNGWAKVTVEVMTATTETAQDWRPAATNVIELNVRAKAGYLKLVTAPAR